MIKSIDDLMGTLHNELEQESSKLCEQYPYRLKVFDVSIYDSETLLPQDYLLTTKKAQELANNLGLDAQCLPDMYGKYIDLMYYCLFKTEIDMLKFKLAWEGAHKSKL